MPLEVIRTFRFRAMADRWYRPYSVHLRFADVVTGPSGLAIEPEVLAPFAGWIRDTVDGAELAELMPFAPTPDNLAPWVYTKARLLGLDVRSVTIAADGDPAAEYSSDE